MQPAPARLASREVPNHQRVPGSPEGHTPMAGTRARVSTKRVHDVMGETGELNSHVQWAGHKGTSLSRRCSAREMLGGGGVAPTARMRGEVSR